MENKEIVNKKTFSRANIPLFLSVIAILLSLGNIFLPVILKELEQEEGEASFAIKDFYLGHHSSSFTVCNNGNGTAKNIEIITTISGRCNYTKFFFTSYDEYGIPRSVNTGSRLVSGRWQTFISEIQVREYKEIHIPIGSEQLKENVFTNDCYYEEMFSGHWYWHCYQINSLLVNATIEVRGGKAVGYPWGVDYGDFEFYNIEA